MHSEPEVAHSDSENRDDSDHESDAIIDLTTSEEESDVVMGEPSGRNVLMGCDDFDEDAFMKAVLRQNPYCTVIANWLIDWFWLIKFMDLSILTPFWVCSVSEDRLLEYLADPETIPEQNVGRVFRMLDQPCPSLDAVDSDDDFLNFEVVPKIGDDEDSHGACLIFAKEMLSDYYKQDGQKYRYG